MEIDIEKKVENFIEDLEENNTAKVLRTIDLLERFDYKLSLPHSKKIQNNLFELRIRGRQEVRIFYTFRVEKIILFYAILKKSQKLLKKDLDQVITKLNNLT